MQTIAISFAAGLAAIRTASSYSRNDRAWVFFFFGAITNDGGDKSILAAVHVDLDARLCNAKGDRTYIKVFDFPRLPNRSAKSEFLYEGKSERG